ncbi:acyltransferase domain-containing protein, partial [Catenulispora rubra]|uniref:acyltransferase domain-containing protein n=1 Tax=Catenulispora rubra TaxID=280293 RepID=UPI002B26A364
MAAGVLSLEDGARLCALRARALSGLSGTGAMASVPLPAADITAVLPAGLEIAAVNGPAHTVVAGPAAVVAEFVAEYQARDIRARLIDVDYASHSVHIESLHSVLAELKISPSQGRIPFYSTVTAARITDTTVLDAGYWWRNLRQPVRFHDTVQALHADGFGMFIESSPHPVLVPALEHSFEDFDTVVIGSLRRDHDGLRQLLGNAARAHVHGAPLIPPGSTDQSPDLLPDLPTYPFQHTRYWLLPAASGSAGALGQDPGGHPLLDAVVAHPDGSITGTAVLTADRCEWIRDHAVYDMIVLPGAALLELVLHIAAGTGHPHLQELTLQAPLILSEDDRLHLNITYRPDPDPGTGSGTVTIHTRPADTNQDPGDAPAWMHHATAVLTAEPAPMPDPVPVPHPDIAVIASAVLYADLHDRGYDYGPTFQGLTDIRHHGHQAWATATLPEPAAADGFLLHPALLDAALHTTFLTTDPHQPDRSDQPVALQLPFTFTDTTIHRHPAVPALTTIGIHTTTEGATHTVTVTGPDDLPILTTHLTTRPLNLRDLTAPETHLHQRVWVPRSDPLVQAASAVEYTIYDIPAGDASPEHSDHLAAVHATVENTLTHLQTWLADPGNAEAHLVVLTHHAIAVHPDDPVDLTVAPVWGLIHSAQNENPHRITLIDTDDHPASQTTLTNTITSAIADQQPHTALRQGTPHTPQL